MHFAARPRLLYGCATIRKGPAFADPRRECGFRASIVAEHVAVIHVVVAHEQVAAIGGIVEVGSEVAHEAVEVVALVDDVPGVVFLVLPLAAVAVLEVVEGFASPINWSWER